MCFHCYTLGALLRISWMSLESLDEEDAETSDLICMHMKNNAIVNTNRIEMKTA